MFKKILPTLITLISVINASHAQFNLAHEIGVTIGPVAFQSDYGERHDFETNAGNTGYAVGLIHYINFSSKADRNTYFNEHFKVRSELSYSSTSFRHFGKWVDQGNNSIGKVQLRAMRGASKIMNLGIQGEFHPVKIHDFENTIGAFDPYASLGLAYSFYNAEATSTLGPLGTSLTTIPKYLTPSDGRPNGFSNESKTVLSVIAGIGTRYKLTTMSDLLVDMRFQYFTSDWVDGLNPNKQIYTENKANDWMVWFNIGYIQYLEF
jgi:hypothetical protein